MTLQEIVKKLFENRRVSAKTHGNRVLESQNDTSVDPKVEDEESDLVLTESTKASSIGNEILNHLREINKLIDQLQALIPDAMYANGLKTHFDQRKITSMVSRVTDAIDKELGILE